MMPIFPRKFLTATLMFVSGLACDRSGAELDHATELLGQVIAERDTLKSKLEAAQRKISYLENEVAVLSVRTAAANGQTSHNPSQRQAKTRANHVTAVKAQNAHEARH
jgi:predicted  nucleic acid-binding Zn-ribbon protein